MVTDRRDRAQLLLVGAITLAFVILGIVVVFNGVLYTETISSGDAGRSASTVTGSVHEVERGIACSVDGAASNVTAEENAKAFAAAYENVTAESAPRAVAIDVEGVDVSADPNEVTVDITYNSTTVSYARTETIEATCPSRDP